MIGLREMGFSCRDITVRAGHTATTAMQGTGPRTLTTAGDDRHLVRTAVTDRTASSTVLAQRWRTSTGVNMSKATVRRRPLWTGLWHGCTCIGRLRLQWTRERHHWRAECQNVVISDESRFKLSNSDSGVRVRRYCVECNRAD
ncbi:hypothetical protein J437_LFUL011819 [Ladona fulva]|uniref:Transposase n=1 Tax=Ladona fulva TaxID=123851 RepID=A0A8K0KCF0_LADFU|nr:hypothetical protein J437_LFUL011819 [Ladona fulva]